MSNLRCKFPIVISLVIIMLSGCQTLRHKEKIGTVIGIVVGGVVGTAFGSGVGKDVATMVGIAAGSIIGNLIGKQLDDADQLKAESAAKAALVIPVGNTVEWKSEKNTSTHGYATPVSDSQQSNGRNCRSIRQVAFVGGEEIEQTDKFCQVGDTGRWVPA